MTLSDFPPKAQSHAYRPDVDGLRAVAVLAVVIFHAFPKLLPGGFIGVDIFFVISGYLITQIIHSNLDSEKFTVSGFYVRRIRRIFPALLTVVIAVFCAGWLIMLPDEFRKLGKHIFGGSAFVSNIFFWHESGYFDSSAETKPLLHFWSLAIEEQYYLVWPLLMAIVWRFKRNFIAINTLCMLISFSINLYLVKHYPSAAYYMPFSRAWELLVGALLAHLTHNGVRFHPAASKIGSVIGFALIFSSLFLIDSSSTFPGWWALMPTLGTFLILGSAESGWLNRALLSSKPLVILGLISYPLYLWHWPILSLLRINNGQAPSTFAKLSCLILAGILAYATYLWIERPIRFNPNPKIIPRLLIGMILVFFVGLAGFTNKIHPRHNGDDLNKIINASLGWDFPGRLKPFKEAKHTAFIIPTDRQEKTFYFGDSHIEQYVGRLTKIAKSFPKEANTTLIASRGGCPPIPGVKRDDDPDCTASIDQGFEMATRPDVKRVVIAACWNCCFKGGSGENQQGNPYYVTSGAIHYPITHGKGYEIAFQNLEQKLKELKANKDVYLILDNPVRDDLDPRSRIHGNRIWGFQVAPARDSIDLDSVETRIRQRLIITASNLGIQILDPLSILCSDKKCVSTLSDGTPVYKDDNHVRISFLEEHASFLDVTLLRR